MSISNKHEPLDVHKLPPDVKETLEDRSSGPSLSEFEVYMKIKKAKKPQSSVKNDILRKILKEFTVEFSKPIQLIFNKITKSGIYPRQWVIEEQVPIPKSNKNPDSLDSIRPISKTNFTSKVYESVLRDWLVPIVGPYLDPSNYGGIKGSSPIFFSFETASLHSFSSG